MLKRSMSKGFAKNNRAFKAYEAASGKATPSGPGD